MPKIKRREHQKVEYCDGQLSPSCHVSLLPNPKVIRAIAAVGHTKSHLSLLVQELWENCCLMSKTQCVVLADTGSFIFECGRGGALCGYVLWHTRWCHTEGCCSPREEGLESVWGYQLLGWIFSNKAKLIESIDLQMAWASLQLLLQKFFRDQWEEWLTTCQAV